MTSIALFQDYNSGVVHDPFEKLDEKHITMNHSKCNPEKMGYIVGGV